MVGGIFADQILCPYFIERPLFYKYNLEQRPVYVTEKKETIIQENTALENAVEKVKKAAIGLKTKTKEGEVLVGSGLIVSSDGLLLTLADLVPKGSTFYFFIDGEATSYQILKRDLENNLALVKVEATNLSTTGFADFDKIKLGERVFLIGAPESKLEVDEGIISSFDENSIKTNISGENNLKGSVLFDIEGNVLGINQINREGKIVAIPVSKIKTFTGF